MEGNLGRGVSREEKDAVRGQKTVSKVTKIKRRNSPKHQEGLIRLVTDCPSD